VVKRGLTADLIHLAAIVELRDQGYRGETFERTTFNKLETEWQQQKEEEHNAAFGVPADGGHMEASGQEFAFGTQSGLQVVKPKKGD
jgi:hypothetical protein